MSGSAPSIHIPPPLILLAGFLAGMGLDWLIPLSIVPTTHSLVWVIVKWGLIGLGIAFGLSGFLTFVRARTGILPNQPVTQFVVHGPYRFSRNPMYVGLTLAYAGFALHLNSLWPLLTLPLALWVLWKLIIQKEEAYLAETYGDVYTLYQKRVRRWI
jgi:protein-S-isoprenylcysteine O-methyltransferase Ste14